jgi:AmmeMemoRadiSam system protein A
MTSDADRLRLLKIARDAIVAHVCGASVPAVDDVDLDGRRGGAFVTLHRGDQLRGCIGHIDARDLLTRVVARCAVSACSADPRFPAVTRLEIDHLSIELSILGPLEPIRGADDVHIGRHGLVVEKAGLFGLLLPQVATEWRWTSEQLLEHTCRKAGLPPDGWKQGATLWRFEAEVFGEPARADGPGGTLPT